MLLPSQPKAWVLQLFAPECRVFVSDYYPTAQVILSYDTTQSVQCNRLHKGMHCYPHFHLVFVLGM